MRISVFSLTLTASLCAPWQAQAGPETAGVGMDLEILDLNGAPFGSFHLGHHAEGLDAEHPTAADALPSEELGQDLGSQAGPDRFTGVDAEAAPTLPDKPDIAPLLRSVDDEMLRPATSN